MKFEFMNEQGRPFDAGEWYACNDEMSSTASAPLMLDGNVVALLVIGEDEHVGTLIGRGTFIVKACNEYAALQEEILTLHRSLAHEKLRADTGWQRYEAANKAHMAALNVIANMENK